MRQPVSIGRSSAILLLVLGLLIMLLLPGATAAADRQLLRRRRPQQHELDSVDNNDYMLLLRGGRDLQGSVTRETPEPTNPPRTPTTSTDSPTESPSIVPTIDPPTISPSKEPPPRNDESKDEFETGGAVDRPDDDTNDAMIGFTEQCKLALYAADGDPKDSKISQEEYIKFLNTLLAISLKADFTFRGYPFVALPTSLQTNYQRFSTLPTTGDNGEILTTSSRSISASNSQQKTTKSNNNNIFLRNQVTRQKSTNEDIICRNTQRVLESIISSSSENYVGLIPVRLNISTPFLQVMAGEQDNGTTTPPPSKDILTATVSFYLEEYVKEALEDALLDASLSLIEDEEHNDTETSSDVNDTTTASEPPPTTSIDTVSRGSRLLLKNSNDNDNPPTYQYWILTDTAQVSEASSCPANYTQHLDTNDVCFLSNMSYEIFVLEQEQEEDDSSNDVDERSGSTSATIDRRPTGIDRQGPGQEEDSSEIIKSTAEKVSQQGVTDGTFQSIFKQLSPGSDWTLVKAAAPTGSTNDAVPDTTTTTTTLAPTTTRTTTPALDTTTTSRENDVEDDSNNAEPYVTGVATANRTMSDNMCGGDIGKQSLEFIGEDCDSFVGRHWWHIVIIVGLVVFLLIIFCPLLIWGRYPCIDGFKKKSSRPPRAKLVRQLSDLERPPELPRPSIVIMSKKQRKKAKKLAKKEAAEAAKRAKLEEKARKKEAERQALEAAKRAKIEELEEKARKKEAEKEAAEAAKRAKLEEKARKKEAEKAAKLAAKEEKQQNRLPKPTRTRPRRAKSFDGAFTPSNNNNTNTHATEDRAPIMPTRKMPRRSQSFGSLLDRDQEFAQFLQQELSKEEEQREQPPEPPAEQPPKPAAAAPAPRRKLPRRSRSFDGSAVSRNRSNMTREEFGAQFRAASQHRPGSRSFDRSFPPESGHSSSGSSSNNNNASSSGRRGLRRCNSYSGSPQDEQPTTTGSQGGDATHKRNLFQRSNSSDQITARRNLFKRSNSSDQITPRRPGFQRSNSSDQITPRRNLFKRSNSSDQITPRRPEFQRSNSSDQITPRRNLFKRSNSSDRLESATTGATDAPKPTKRLPRRSKSFGSTINNDQQFAQFLQQHLEKEEQQPQPQPQPQEQQQQQEQQPKPAPRRRLPRRSRSFDERTVSQNRSNMTREEFGARYREQHMHGRQRSFPMRPSSNHGSSPSAASTAATTTEVSSMSIKEIKADLERLNVPHSDCFEKAELVERLSDARRLRHSSKSLDDIISDIRGI